MDRTVELGLIQDFQQGDRSAGETLLRAHEGFIRLTAQKFSRWDDRDLQDLCQAGRIGFMQACELYDPGQGTRLLTFAGYHIKSRIRRTIINEGSVVRIPSNQYRPGNDRELRSHHVNLFCEMPNVIWDGYEVSFEDSLVDEGPLVEDFLGGYESQDKLQSRVDQAVTELTEREQDILNRYYGETPLTLEMAGQLYGLSRERIRQIIQEALKKIRVRVKNQIHAPRSRAEVDLDGKARR